MGQSVALLGWFFFFYEVFFPIPNFSIIAHIDHGKSTLADRLLEKCNAVTAREMESQLLDNMDLERERASPSSPGPCSIFYTAQDGEQYA